MKRMLLAVILTLASMTAAQGRVDVFVSIPPQQWLVENVGGERVVVNLLVPAGQDPHVFEPRPKQVASLTTADIWYLLGLEFEHQLEGKVKALAPQLDLIDMGQDVARLSLNHDEHDHDEAEHHDDQHGEENEHGDVDPHVWLAPSNLIQMAKTVAQTLTAKDPDGATYYASRLQDVTRELSLLDSELQRKLAPVHGFPFYVFHPSFGYFAHAYGLIQEPVEVGGKSPSPRQLASLISKARKEGARVIFVQPQFDPKSAQAVAAGINGVVQPLDALAYDVVGNLRIMAEKISTAWNNQ